MNRAVQQEKYSLADQTQYLVNLIGFWWEYFNSTHKVKIINGKEYLEFTDDVKFLLSTGIKALLTLGDAQVKMYRMVESILNDEEKEKIDMEKELFNKFKEFLSRPPKSATSEARQEER